ncbi:MAG: sigma-54-dependent Fis family transcriptional regulator [Nitrospirae bacterium]|nr:MAG: sigma-54-dependent Fis family transcriptional regulator [Nitrospirota bacterium]
MAVLDKETREGPGAFSPEDERFLRSLASLAAAAIWTSRTFAAVERERQLLEEENLRLRELAGSEGFIGDSPAIRRVLEVARRAAVTDASVMIRGESGVGKERLARLIHRLSPRRDGPFVPLDCTALPESLLEAELFGIEEGVATGVRRRLGKLELATGGTLFLDEVGDLALTLQAKLLRVVQERELERVGGRQRIPLDVRLITATHRPLETMVEEGSFRRDLYFRLRVVVIELPPLRERPTDIPLLARHFLALYGSRFGRPDLRLSAGALARLLSHPWPGNVRELENVIQAAVALAPRPVIEADDLPLGEPAGEDEGSALAPLREVERRHILRVLEAVGGSRSRAARLLGIDRSTLYRKLRQFASEDAERDARDPASQR